MATPTEEDNDWFSDQFDVALAKLNEFLIAVAAVSGDPAIGPVSRLDLPLAAVLLAGPVDSGAPPEVSIFLLNYGPQGQADLLSPEQAEHISNIVAKQHGDGHPFFSLGEALVEARRAGSRGRVAHAVLELGTAFELLVSTVVREVGAINGLDDQKVQGVLTSGLKNVLEHHLPKLIGVDVDLLDPQNVFGRWNRDAYVLRNAVVHEGLRPVWSQLQDASKAVEMVIETVARALKSRAETELLGQMLASERPATSP